MPWEQGYIAILGESPVFLYILIPQTKSGDFLLTASLLKYMSM